ncbi:vicilin Cor a 11 [Capsicum chacoense]
MAIFTKPKFLFLFFFILSLFLASQCDDQNPPARRELESCLMQCKAQGEPPEQQFLCQKSCILRYGSEKKETLKELIEGILTKQRDPQEKLRECQQRCERQQKGQQKQSCKQRCEQEYKREQEQQGKGKRDPEQRHRECVQRCWTHERAEKAALCQDRCDQEFEREKKQHRGEEETRDENKGRGNRDPEERLRECIQRCATSTRAGDFTPCARRCDQEYRGEKGQHGGPEETGDENQGRGKRDPEERFRECQQRCQTQEEGQQQRECQQRCQQEYKREKEEEQQHGQEETGDENQGRGKRDPEQKFKECIQWCGTHTRAGDFRPCAESCRQEREKEQQQHGQEETGDENQGRGKRDPEQKFKECIQWCGTHTRAGDFRPCAESCRQEREKEQQQHGQEETGDENQGRGKRDPEQKFKECIQWCGTHTRAGDFRPCAESCRQEREKEQQQHGQEETGDENQGRGKRDPEQKFKECIQWCGTHTRAGDFRPCADSCRREREKEERPGKDSGEEDSNPQKREENNPYLFESQRFSSPFRTGQGHLRIVEKFTQRSELFRGIEKYRVAVLEFEPQSFMVPNHCDGETIYVVARGQGIISIAEQDAKYYFTLEKAHVMRVPAGATIYFVNRDKNEKLVVYMLVKSIDAPGQAQEYFSGGGQNPESFYRAFSSDILEKAFNTRRDRLEKLFGQQSQGPVIKASEEQIRAISRYASLPTKHGIGEIRGPFNLLQGSPLFESRFGQFFEASPENFEQLRDLDVAVGYMNINQGGMVLPYYNTKSTRLVMVLEGSGRFEMACPHLGSQKQGQGSRGEERGQEEQEQDANVHYQKVRGNLNVGDLLVVPASHPITFIATGGSNLRMVGFGINARNNKKSFLAGKQNIWRNVDREAKELSFNMPGREVEEIFQKQDQSYFVTGPGQQREKGEQGKRGQELNLSSILDFVF